MTRRHFTFITLLALAALPFASAQSLRLREGYVATYIAPPSDVIGAALAADPFSPDSVYCTLGSPFNTDHAIYHVDLTDPQSPIFTLVVGGAFSNAELPAAPATLGDNVLDSLFGTVGGIAALPTGELIIVDNNERAFASPAVPGDTIYIARDLNTDGDFMDVVDVAGTPTPEVTELLASIPGAPTGTGYGGFSGVQAEVGPDGAVYVVTADGFNTGEVIRITDPAGTPTASIFFDGLDFGAGLAVVGDSVWVGDVDDSFTFARLWKLTDRNSDGDALDGGEIELRNATLSGVSDFAFANDDALVLSTFVEMFTFPNSPQLDPQGALILGQNLYFGDVAADSSGDAFGPFAGSGSQRIYTTGTDFAGTSRLVVFEPTAATPIALSEPLYESASIAPPLGGSAFGSVIAAASDSSDVVFLSLGNTLGNDAEVWSADISDPTYPLYTRLAAGPADTDANGELDSRFGNIGGLAMLSTGEMIIVDNNTPSSAIGGDTIYIARDLNADGDFLDIVASAEEVQELIATIPGAPSGSGFGGFSGVQAKIGPDSAVYIITADGFDAGEIIRIADPTGSPAASIFADGLDFGAGLAWIGSDLHMGDVDDSFTFARLWRSADGNADDDALDVGETSLVTSGLSGMVSLAAGPGATLWQSQFTTLNRLDTSTGLIDMTLLAPTGFNFLGDCIFTATNGSFTPGSVDRQSLAVTSSDFAGSTFLNVVTPAEFTTTAVRGYGFYR